MQSLKEAAKTNKLFTPEQTLLETYVCEGCSETVNKTEFVIPFGPREGETYIGNVGCKCEDLKLANEAKQMIKQKGLSIMMKHFDSHSLLNESLNDATFENYQPTNVDTTQGKKIAEDYVANFNGRG